MDSLHQYVASISKDITVDLRDGHSINYKDVDMWETLFGGDQLTAARIRGAISIWANYSTILQSLEGLINTHSRRLAHKNDSSEGLIKKIYILSLYIHYICRLSGTGFFQRSQPLTKVPSISSRTSSIVPPCHQIHKTTLMLLRIS